MKPAPPFSATEAEGLFQTAVLILERLEDREINSRRPSTPLPRGVFNCGEAELIVSTLIAMLAHVYPEAMPHDDVMALAETHFRRLN